MLEYLEDSILRNYDLSLLYSSQRYTPLDERNRRLSAQRLEDLFVSLHQVHQPTAIFEIGAYGAEFSQRVAAIAPSSQCFAFEANPYVYAMQTAKTDFSALRVQYMHSAISNKTGEEQFNVQKQAFGIDQNELESNNSIIKRVDENTAEQVTVPCITISDFIKQQNLNGVYSAWIDVEGAQNLVLEGAKDVLHNFLYIYIEVEDYPQWKDQWNYFEVMRYLVRNGFTPVARDFQFTIQFNMIFLRNDIFSLAAFRNLISSVSPTLQG